MIRLSSSNMYTFFTSKAKNMFVYLHAQLQCESGIRIDQFIAIYVLKFPAIIRSDWKQIGRITAFKLQVKTCADWDLLFRMSRPLPITLVELRSNSIVITTSNKQCAKNWVRRGSRVTYFQLWIAYKWLSSSPTKLHY